MHCLFLFICVFLSSIRTRTYCSDVLKDMDRSWEEPWKHVVEDVGDIDEHLNKLAQDHPYVIETIQDNFILKPHLDTVQMNQNMWTRVDFPGQFKQADIVMEILEWGKRGGTFFEAGAADGMAGSNTLKLELKYGWTGLLVEADPDNYGRLLRESSRNVLSVGACISRKTHPETVLFDKAGLYGSIIVPGKPRSGDNIPSNQRKIIKESIAQIRQTLRMQCFPLYSMLKAAGMTKLDYISLDLEGIELEVLKSLPWEKVDIKLISLEVTRGKLDESLDFDHVDQRDEIVNYLSQKEYELIYEQPHTSELITYELYFAHKSIPVPNKVKEKVHSYKSPFMFVGK